MADALVIFPFQRCLDRDECRVRLKRNVRMQLEILESPMTSYAISVGSLVVSMLSLALTAYNMNGISKTLTALEVSVSELKTSVKLLNETTIKKFW